MTQATFRHVLSAVLTLDPKSLIMLLTPTVRTALEGAVAGTVRRRHYEVTLGHLLLSLFQDEGSDAAVLLARRSLAVAPVVEVLELMLAPQRTGNTGRPTFSPLMLQLMEDAWLTVSTRRGDQRVRSAAMLSLLALDVTPYLPGGERLSPVLRVINAPEPAELAGAREEAEAHQEAPRIAAPRLPRDTVHHKVAPGETLIAIARRFAIDVEDVARDNDIGINDALRPGTGLRLRVLPRDVVPRASGAG